MHCTESNGWDLFAIAVSELFCFIFVSSDCAGIVSGSTLRFHLNFLAWSTSHTPHKILKRKKETKMKILKARKYAIVFSAAAVISVISLVLLGQAPLPGFRSLPKVKTEEPGAKAVKEMMSHAWSGYYRYAKYSDELLPISKHGSNWTRISMCFTAVDSLDTLFIMGLTKEYQQAKELVLGTSFDEIDYQINHFEVTIRSLGGLLAANDLDPDPRYVKMAVDLADRLIKAFDSPTGIPYSRIDLQTGDLRGGPVSIATAGTLQLEFQYLSDITGDPKYQDKALYALEQLHYMPKDIPGLFPTHLNVNYLEFESNNQYGLGAENDSFYEYLLKLYLSTGNEKFKNWYQAAADVLFNLFRP
jgi:hypothetical protein